MRINPGNRSTGHKTLNPNCRAETRHNVSKIPTQIVLALLAQDTRSTQDYLSKCAARLERAGAAASR
eukprot:6439890-Lingulodinium_polyedra.AAC.1